MANTAKRKYGKGVRIWLAPLGTSYTTNPELFKKLFNERQISHEVSNDSEKTPMKEGGNITEAGAVSHSLKATCAQFFSDDGLDFAKKNYAKAVEVILTYQDPVTKLYRVDVAGPFLVDGYSANSETKGVEGADITLESAGDVKWEELVGATTGNTFTPDDGE